MLTSLLSVALWALSTKAQRETNFSELWNVTTYPNTQLANVSQYLYEASDVAGEDLDDHFQRRCILSQIYDDLASYAQASGKLLNPGIALFKYSRLYRVRSPDRSLRRSLLRRPKRRVSMGYGHHQGPRCDRLSEQRRRSRTHLDPWH